MSKVVTDVKKWFVLVGCEETGSVMWHIDKWDHYPTQEEIDTAVKRFNDEKIDTVFLLEEVARGRSTIQLKSLVEKKPEVKKDSYKMPALSSWRTMEKPTWVSSHPPLPRAAV